MQFSRYSLPSGILILSSKYIKQRFLNQTKSKIEGLRLNGDIDNFVDKLNNWDGYKNYYSSGKFIFRGGYMNMDKLRTIHSNSNHPIFDAYTETQDSVYDVYRNESNDLYPVIPFVLIPKEFTFIKSGAENTISYKLEREGRSRLSGVLKARRKGEYNKSNVPVQFSIRRARR